MNIQDIINKSFHIKEFNNDSIVDIKHIKESIKILYPDNPKLIEKCDTFYSKFKYNEIKFHLQDTQNISDVYLIFRSYNFDKGTENAAKYLLGLLAD